MGFILNHGLMKLQFTNWESEGKGVSSTFVLSSVIFLGD